MVVPYFGAYYLLGWRSDLSGRHITALCCAEYFQFKPHLTTFSVSQKFMVLNLRVLCARFLCFAKSQRHRYIQEVNMNKYGPSSGPFADLPLIL